MADPARVPRFVTLVPGDILLTGTPAGVGVFRKPPVFLKVRGEQGLGRGWGASGDTEDPTGDRCHRVPPLQRGDEVQCEIEELGAICNRVV